MTASVVAVHRDAEHRFSKASVLSIRLLAGLGVEGDAHCGATVKHRSRRKVDASQPNLRQVHLLACELFDELRQLGFTVAPGEMGENITTRGISLPDLPTATRLHLGATAVVELKGLRNPCSQIDRFQPGLMRAVLVRDEKGALVRKAGVMAVVIAGGEVRPRDVVGLELPAGPPRELAVV